MMFRFALVVVVFLVVQPTHTEASVNVVYEDIECNFLDKEYFSNVDAYMADDNAVALNITIMKTLPEYAVSHVFMYGMSMGEYVVPSGIDTTMNICEMLDEPIILGPAMRVLGFDPDGCPPPPGNYGSESYVVPAENFPDDFASNKYLFTVAILVGDRCLLRIELTIDIK